MRKKDTTYLAIGLALLVVVGILVYAKYGIKGKDKGITSVEVIDPISNSFDQGSLNTLNDPSKAKNFQPAISLDGLGNARPFGPLR